MVGCNNDKLIVSEEKNLITTFQFLAEDNPLYLEEDIAMTVEEGTITGRVPYYTDVHNLIATFEYEGKSIKVGNELQESGMSVQDYSDAVVFNVTSKAGNEYAYQVNLTVFTGLPVLFINTEEGVSITSKDDYVEGTVTLDGYDILPDYDGEMKIRGRGNSTWGLPKKPYQIKLDKKAALLGDSIGADKKWVLLANYSDKTMLRNELAFEMSRASNLAWTPASQFVEVFINDVYNGTYQLVQKIEISENKVDVGDDGFLLDVDSFVDWYLVNEIAKNNDAIFFSSCYMNISLDGKLKMGPVWDFDIAYGNVYYNGNDVPSGLYIMDASWISRLFEDPTFVELVQQRYSYFMTERTEFLRDIQEGASSLNWAQQENDSTWQTIGVYVWPNAVVLDSYDDEVANLEDWLNVRMLWLDGAYDDL